jgi:hypothetical protein
MPAPRLLDDDGIDTFLRDFLASDLNLGDFARSRSFAPSTAYRWASMRGVAVPTRRRLRVDHPPFAEVVARFEAGESVQALSIDYGVSRVTVDRWLRHGGREPRNRSEAMLTRMAATDAAERARLTEAAHAAARGRKASPDELARRAASPGTRRRLVRLGENELAQMLRERGIIPEPQWPIGPYNVDLAVAPVAVEVHRRTGHPMRTAVLRERAVHIADAGWRVLYVWCSQSVRTGRGVVCFSEACADQVVAHVQRAQADPASVREHRVIRCTGEDAP